MIYTDDEVVRRLCDDMAMLRGVASPRTIDEVLAVAAAGELSEESGFQNRAARRQQSNPRRLRLAVGASAAAVLAATSAIFLDGGSAALAAPTFPAPLAVVHGSHAAAVAVLRAAALKQQDRPVAASSSVTSAKTIEYALSEDIKGSRVAGQFSTVTREVQKQPDGHTTVKEYNQETLPTGALVDGSQSSVHTGSYGPGGWADYNDESLPSQPAAAATTLLHSYTDWQGEVPDVLIGDAVATRLGLGTALPSRVALLEQVLATLPSAFDAGTVIDQAGRTGHAIGIQVSDSDSIAVGTEYIIVDPATGGVLEVEKIDNPPPPALKLPPVPTVEQYNLILTSAS